MGCTPSNFKGVYNVRTNNADKQEGETFIYRHPNNPEGNKQYKYSTIQDLMRNLFATRSPTSPAFEERIKGTDGEYTMKTKTHNFRDFKSECESFGRGMINLNLCQYHAEFRDYNLRFMGIYAKNSYRYFVQDMASVMFNVVSVPIYDTLGEEATIFVFENTQMESLCLTMNHLDGMLKMKEAGKIPSLQNFIIIDEENWSEEFTGRGDALGVKIYKWSDIVNSGASGEKHDWVQAKAEDIYCFSYTSGTTGTPKGVMLSHKNLASTIQACYVLLDVTSKDKHLSYLPMAHIFERIVSMTLLSLGCVIGIFAGNVKKIKEDLAVFKPTIFISVPRLYNRFYDVIKDNVSKLEGSKKKLAEKAIKTKTENLHKNGEVTHWLWDKLVFKKIKNVLGGRVRFMVTGSAPLNMEVANFLKVAMCCPMVEGYGQTEGTGAEFGMRTNDTVSGHVGGVLEHNEFKLVDVPEMNYTSEDVDEKTGERAPRGEIWVRGSGIIPGYYKNEAKNQETFTEDGWLKSGDIGMITPGQNKLVIIDRKKNIFKLSQGEYIAPEKLEGDYKTISGMFRDIYIFGNSLKSCVVAIVTIEKENQRAVAEMMQVCADVPDEDLITHPDFKKGLKAIFTKKAKEVKFNGLEIPKGFVVNETPFEELGLLTTSFKMKRKPIAEHFMEQLEEEYAKLY